MMCRWCGAKIGEDDTCLQCGRSPDPESHPVFWRGRELRWRTEDIRELKRLFRRIVDRAIERGFLYDGSSLDGVRDNVWIRWVKTRADGGRTYLTVRTRLQEHPNGELRCEHGLTLRRFPVWRTR